MLEHGRWRVLSPGSRGTWGLGEQRPAPQKAGAVEEDLET